LSEGKKGVYYIFSEGSQISDINIFKKCPECKSHYEPIIITPTMVKSYDDKLCVKQSGAHAEDSIKNADKVVFIGYSLSDSDYFTKFVLIRALAENRKKKIELVTSPKAGSCLKIKERYERLFGSNIECHEGFQKYVESL
jgi:hypothetical protein